MAADEGELELGVGDPLELSLTLSFPGVGSTTERIPIFQVPPDTGFTLAYAGAVGACTVSLDAEPVSGDEVDWDGVIGIGIRVVGLSPSEALRGLAFLRAFEESDAAHLDCAGLFPQGGYDVDLAERRGDVEDPDADRYVESVALMALALQALEQYDGAPRVMPEDAEPAELIRASIIFQMLRAWEVAVSVPGGEEFSAALPADAQLTDDVAKWVSFRGEMPPLVGTPSLIVDQSVLNATPLRIERTERGGMALICRADPSGGSIVTRPVPREP
jgi:hypothetical protein